MSTILPFPTQSRAEAPRFLTRARGLQEVTCHLQDATRDLGEEVGSLLEGDTPTVNDHSMSGKIEAEIGEALRKLILTNGAPDRHRTFTAALNRWLREEHCR